MSNYTKSTNFATKDALSSGNPLKIVKGTEIDTEFNNIQTAIATKLDSNSGTISSATITTSTIDSSTIGATTPSTGAFTTLSATGATSLTGATTISNAVLPVIDNIKLGYTTTATAAGTTTLTAASNNQQFFTGSTTQTVVLPVTSTLALGVNYLIVNNSTGVITVQSSGANTITLIPAGMSVRCTCILITGTTAASWSFAFEGGSNIPYKQIQTITATIASNALTLGLNPCSLDFRSSTATSGATTTRNFTTAISITVSNGSTLGTTNGVLSKLAVLAIDNAGTVELAVVNADAYGLLDERLLISTTAEGGVGSADSGTVIYSTTSRTNVPFRIVGYVESTQSTAGAWATSPSNIAGMGGDIQSNINKLTSGTAWTYSSAVSTIDFTPIPSWVKRITVMFDGVSTSGSSPTIIQLGYSGGFTGATYNSSASGATSGVSSVTTTVGLYAIGTPAGGGSGSAYAMNGMMTLANINSNKWVSMCVVGQNSVAHTNWAGGVGTAGGTLTQIRITTVNGTDTFDAGSINILYE
jgi:hypothetical protein